MKKSLSDRDDVDDQDPYAATLMPFDLVPDASTEVQQPRLSTPVEIQYSVSIDTDDG